MSVTNLVRYGTTETPDAVRAQRWKQKFADRKLLNKERIAHNKRIAEAKPLITFDTPEALRLIKLANARATSFDHFYRTMAFAHQESGITQVRITPERAKDWAAWMRSPGVDAFGPTLAQIETAAGRRAPQGKAIKLAVSDFLAILGTLEGEAAASVPDAGPAAQFLRAARFERGVMHIYASPERAARLADVLAAVGIVRGHIVALDRIAGRPEPRAF